MLQTNSRLRQIFMDQHHLGGPAALEELHCYLSLRHSIERLLPLPGKGERLRRTNFQEAPIHVDDSAIFDLAHSDPVSAAYPEINLDLGWRPAGRAPPFLESLRICPCAEDLFPWSGKAPPDSECNPGGLFYRGRDHDSSSSRYLANASSCCSQNAVSC